MKVLIIPVLCGFLGACSPGEGRRIIVYSPHGKEMLGAFEKLFEERYPGVDVQWLDMGSQDALDRIRTERENPQADVWWGAPAMLFAAAEREGLLERYIPAWDSAVATEHKSADGFWYGTFLTPEVIMYNNRVLKETEAPQDWDDLLSPQWEDKIIIRYPLASGTMRMIFAALIQREVGRTGSTDAGFDWLRRLDANTKTYTADPTQLYLKIAREEGLVTLWNLPDVVIQVNANNYPFGYVLPASGTPVITDCIALVRGGRNRADAERFYEFVTSREAMLEQARSYSRIPARTDLAEADLPEWIRTLAITPMSVDWSSVVMHEKAWMKEWDERVKGMGRRARNAAP